MGTPKRVDELDSGTPTLSDYALITPTGGPSIRCTVSDLLALGSGGVSSLNSLTGKLSIVAGSNITVTPAGSNITIASTGGSSAKTVNAQTGTTYTLVLGDANNIVTLNSTAGITLTIPLNSSVAFPVGTSIDLIQLNSGQVTVTGVSGVTLNATPGKKLRTQYAGCSIVQIATNSWTMHGDTTS